MTDCTSEFPDDWFEDAKLSPEKRKRVGSILKILEAGFNGIVDIIMVEDLKKKIRDK